MSTSTKTFFEVADKPTPQYMRELIDRYRGLMAKGDLDGIMALFTDDARWEEPVGTTPALGKDQIRARYNAALTNSGGAIRMIPDGAIRIAGNRAMASSLAQVYLNGEPIIIETANAITCNEDGLITEMLVYVGLENFRPGTLD